MFKFITGKPLWANILFGIVVIILLLFLFLFSLDWITRHDRTLIIPAVLGKQYSDAKKMLEDKGFNVEIQDSVYNDTAAPLAVLRQFPDADAVVKVNRTVYLTINSAVAPVEEMPNLEGLTFRSAQIVMKQYRLKLEDTVYRPDFAKDNVMEQKYKGERIKAGTKISMGSSIVLVLGAGLMGDEFSVPDLVGLSYNDAKVLLESQGLSMGVVIPKSDVTDLPNAFVYQQRPDHSGADGKINRIRQGQTIDLFLQVNKPDRDSTAIPQPNAPQ